MDIGKLTVGTVIEIAPNIGDTVTAWSRADRKENIGHLNRGEEYKVHKLNGELGMVELEEYQISWPSSLHPVSWGGVWVDVRFVELPGTVPVPVPVPTPIPVPTPGSLKSLATKLGQALLDWSKE